MESSIHNTIAVQVGSTVQRAITDLQLSSLSNTSCYDSLKEAISLIPNIGWLPGSDDLINHLQEAQAVFVNKHFSRFAQFLLDNFSPSWLQLNENGQSLVPLIDGCILHGPPEEAFLLLTRSIASKQSGICRIHCIGLTEKLLRKGCLKRLFIKYCCDCPLRKLNADENQATGCLSKDNHLLMQQWNDLTGSISSLPDIILSNSSSVNTAEFFFPRSYIPFVMAEVLTTLRAVHDCLQQELTVSVLPVSVVIGKLAMIGYADLVWSNLLSELEMLNNSDFLWQRISHHVVADIPDRNVEPVLIQLATNVSSHKSLARFLGIIPVCNRHVNFILTHKLVLVRYYEYTKAVKVLKNLFGYLSKSDQQLMPLFLSCFQSLLAAWSDGSSLRHRSAEQSLYVCQGVVVALSFITSDKVTDLRQDIVKYLLDGLPGYLGSSVPDIRQMGCFVAEKLSLAVHVTGQEPLCFNLEQNELVKGLQELSVHAETEQDHQPFNEEQISQKVKEPEPECTFITDKKVGDRASDQNGHDKFDLDSDDEDDLAPYANACSNPKMESSKRPRYVAQCLEGLAQTDDPDRAEQCLLHAESIIRSCSATAVDEIAVDFIRILLHLDNRFAFVDFSTLRFKIMVALTVACPVKVADLLGKEFYARNYSIRQRMDILDVLSAAAAELSEPAKRDVQNPSVVKQNEFFSYGKDEDPVHQHWSEIVRKRVEAKTRRYRQTKTSISVVTPSFNRFSSCAGYFFFSLMHFVDRQTEACIDLLGVDHLLFERLLYELGKIVFLSRALPCARKMCVVLLDFVRCARHHTEPGVRRAVLFAVCCALVAMPPGSVCDDSVDVFTDVGEWLKSVTQHDPDLECQKRSSDTLLVLEAAMHDALTS